MQQLRNRGKNFGIEPVLPTILLRKSKQFSVLCGSSFNSRRVLLQLPRQIGQLLNVGLDLAPVRPSKKCVQFFLVGRLVPRSPCFLCLLRKIFVLEKGAALDSLCTNVFVKVRAHTAFGGVDLQTTENGQGLNFSAAALPFARVGAVGVGDHAAIHSGIADLADAGGKGILHRAEPLPPVVCIRQRRRQGWDLQQGQIGIVGKLLIYLVFIITLDTAVQDRIGNGLDLVAIVVRSAQTLRRQRVGRHKDHIGQMAKIVFAQFIPGRIDGKLQFFVAGEVFI